MGNTSQKSRHVSGDESGPQLVAGRYGYSEKEFDHIQVINPNTRRPRAATTLSQGADMVYQTPKLLPAVFKWEGGGKDIYLAGSFNKWAKIPLVKSHGDFLTIIELPEGEHQYKFFVDGSWQHNPSEPTMTDNQGNINNTIQVRKADFEVFEALALDSLNVNNSKKDKGHTQGSVSNSIQIRKADFEVFEALALDSLNVKNSKKDKGRESLDDEYGQEVPVRKPGEKVTGPPILPPHLLQVILNKDIPAHCEPTLLPEPNHVMLNHLYALSIKDGVMVLSATHRFRKKYVTTLLYKPI
ncbi:PRKAB [Mytilus coruscus]|uniref:5'-AMP-activated protein kinase subunit beta-1 n=1 Tax=Mytilus coruscus TaxID=42192 RepID=A0A6J8CFX3_MYTCO|nr:PRKAB [Mytilus coruscus]